MNSYTDSLTIKDALQVYFSHYHFKDGGYADKYFKIKFGRLFIPVPNIKARVEAVKFHDVHHLVTEYNAQYKGEVEIGAWEIASGCGKYWVAWILNLSSFFIGVLLYQRSLFSGFMEGRHAKTNLYSHSVYNDVLLNKTVGELRREILPSAHSENSIIDYVLFFLWCIISVLYHLAFAAAGLYIVLKLVSLFRIF
jgi:hypothetical protein